MSWEGYDNSQVPYPGRRHYKNDQHEDFTSENRDNYKQENRGEYPLEMGFEYQVENRVDYTSTLAQDVDYIQEQDVDVGYTQEDLGNDFDQRTNRICNSRSVFTHQWVRNKRGHQFYRGSSYRGRNKHLTSKMRHLSEQENRSPSISPRDSYRKYSRDTRSPSSISPQCSNERLSTSPTSPHCATERISKSHRFRDSSEKYSHRRRRSRSYERYRSRSKGMSRSRSPRRESRKRSCEKSGRSYCGSRDSKDSYRSDYSPGRSDKNRCKSTELKVSGGSYKYSPDKDYKYSNTSRHKKSASSSNKDRKKKKTSWKKEEEDMTENLPRASDKSKIENCNDIENVVSDGIKAIRYGLVPQVNKKQEKVTRTKQAMRHKHQNKVLNEHDLECLHTKNDRYHYYRDPNNSTDKSSSNKSTDNSSSNKLIDNNSSNKSTDKSSSNKSTDNSSSNKSTDNSSSNKSRGDKSIEKTSKETSVFDNSYKNIKVKLSSNAIKLAKSITDVCKTHITADGKRSFSDIKGGEQVSNDVKKLKLSIETSEDKLVSNDVKKLKLSSETSENKLVSNDVKKLKLSSETSENKLVSNDVKKLKLSSETSEDKLVSNDVKKLKLSSETSEDIVTNVNMSGDKVSVQSGCESVFTSSRVHTEVQDQSLNDNLIRGKHQKNRAHSIQSNADMSNDNIQPVYHTKHTDAGVNKLQTHVATIYTGARPIIETTHKSLPLDTQEVVPYFTNISKEDKLLNKLLNKLDTRKPLLPTPKLEYMNTAGHVTHNSKPISSWNRFHNRTLLSPSPGALHVDVMRNTCQYNEQSMKLPQDLPNKEQLDSNLSKGSVDSEENTNTSLETGQTEKTNVEENMMAIRQEQSKYQEKQGDEDCRNDVNVKTVGSYYVQNTSKDVVKKTEMIVNNSDDQKRKKSDQNKFKNVQTSDQKEVKVRKSDQKEMKVKCLYKKEVTLEKKLIKNASFNSLDNTEVLYIKHKQEKKCHSSGQVIKPASMPAANQKPSDGDNNNNVHDIGRRESSKVREHVKKIENAKQKLPTDSTMDITKDYQCSGASGITQNTVHSDKKLDTMRKSNMATSVGEKEPSTRSDANSKSENRSIYRGKKEHSSKSTEHSSKSTEHSSKSTDHSSKSTEHSSKSTAHSSKSTEHSSKYTAHSSKSIEHSSKSTEYSSKSTEHSSKSTAHSSKSTEHSSKFTVTDLQSLVKDDMTLSLESSKDQTTNINELSMSPKNQNIENKMTSTPVAHGRKASGHRDLLLSPVESIKILSGNESIDKCRHGTGSECGKDKNKCTVTSNTISESDCSTDDFMVLDSWQEASPSKINDEKSQNETKPQPCDKEQEQTTSQINTDIDKANTVGDKFAMKKKFKSVTSSPLKFTTIKKMKSEKKKMKALAKAAAKIFKENMMSNRGKGNKDELENEETHKMSIDTESHDKLKISPIMDKKAESHDKSKVSQSMDKKAESHDTSNVSQSMDKKAESHDKSKVSQNMDKKAESHDKSKVSQSMDKKAESHDKSKVSLSMDKKAESHDKSKVSQNMDKKPESHDKSKVSQSMDKKAESHDTSNVSQSMDKKAESHDKSKVSQNMDKKAESHDKSKVSQSMDKKAESHDKSKVSLSMDKKAESHDKSKVSQNMDKKPESHDKSKVSQSMDKKAESHDKSKVSQSMDKKAESHDKSNVSQSMDKKAESHDKSKVSLGMDKKAESHDKSKVSQNMDKKPESHDKSKVSQNIDKKAESHDKSNVSQSPFHSLFGRKIRTCLEDFPLIKTPKKDKSSDDKEVLASVSNPALSLPVNVEQTPKEKLKPKKNVINVKLDKQIKYGSLTNEEMEIKTNKYSEHNTEMGNNITSSKKQFVAIEEMKHVEIQDSETNKIYQQEIKLTDRSKEKSHDRNILCQTKQETKHLKCEKNNNKKEVDDLKKRDNKGNHANKKEEKSHKRFKTDKEQCTTVESKTKQSTMKHKEHKTDCLEKETEIQKDKVEPKTKQSTTKHKEHKTDCLEKETEIQKDKVEPKTKQSTTKHKEHKTDCLEKETEIQKDKVEPKTKQSTMKHKEHKTDCLEKETEIQKDKVELKTNRSTTKHKEHKTDCLEKESEIQKDKVELKTKQSTTKHKEHKTDCLEKESEIQKDKVEPKTKQSTTKHKEHKTDCLEKESEIQKDKVEPKTKQSTTKHKEHKTDCLEKETEIQKYKVAPNTEQSTTKHREHKTDCLEKESEIQKDKVELKTNRSKGKLQECSQKETYLQNEKGLKTLEINYRSKHEIDQKEAKILNDEIVLKNKESNRLEPDNSQTEKDNQKDCLHDKNNDLSIIDSFHENEDVDVYTDNDIQSTHTTDEYDDSFECVGIIENVDLCTIDTLSFDEKEKLDNVKDVEINQNTSISTEYDMDSGEEIDENELLVDFESFGPEISQEVEIQTSFEEVCPSVVEELEISTSNEVLPCHTVQLEITNGNCAENSTDEMSTSVSVEDIGNFVGQNQLVNTDNNQESVNVVNGKIIVDNSKPDESSKSQTGLTVDKFLTLSTVDRLPPESTVDKTPTESTVDKPQTVSTVGKPQTELTVDKPPTELTVDKPPTKSTVDKPSTESTVDKPPTKSTVDKSPPESTVDKPPTESTVDKPPTESTVDKPPTESTVDKPPTKSTVDKPSTELTVDKPSTELTVDKPPTKSTADKPSTELTVDKPPTKSTVDKPSTELTVDKPSTELTVDKPSTESTVDKPPTKSTADKPPTKSTADKPSTELTVDKPPTELNVDKPPTKSTVGKPPTKSTVDKPPTKSTADKPSTELTVDKPPTELNVDKPPTKSTVDKPPTKSTVDKPPTELNVDKPRPELTIDKPSTELTVDKPQTESSVDKPPTEFTIDKPPTELNVDKPPREVTVDETPTELTIDKPSTELTVDKPQTELTVDKPRTELTVDKPSTELTVDKRQAELTVDKPQTDLTVDKPQTELTVDKPQTELTVDKPPTELTVDKPRTEFTIDKSPTELNVDEQLPELAVDKTPTELTFNKPPTELTVDQLQTELTVDKPPTEMTVDKSITKIQKTGETSKHKTPVNTKTVNKTTVKAITINKVHSVVMETTKCVKERDSSSQGSAKANVMKNWKFSNKAKPLKTRHVTPGKSKVMKDNTGIKRSSKSLDSTNTVNNKSTNTVNNKSTNTLNNKSVDQSFLKTSHSAVKESEIKTSTGHFRKLATQESEKSDDLVTMPVPCSDTEHRNDSKPCQNDHQQNEASDISELKIISVCGNVDFDQPMNTEQESSLQVTENIHVNILINDEVDDGRPTPSVDNLDQILNSTPMIKYNNITNDNVENKKDGNVTKPESNTCDEVTKLPSLVNKNKHSGSLSQTFAMMETNSNSITDESDLDSSGDKLVIDMNSKSESESTLSNSQSDSLGVDQLRMIPTETRQDLDTMATVNTASRSSYDTVSNQEMSSKAVTTENNQYLCKTEESKATGMETVSTSLEETMIYANSDLDTSKDTVEYCERRQTTDESTISNDNKEVEDYDDCDDDIQIMWYIKGVPQSPWTSDTPHIKQEMMDDDEEDDEFKQPPVLPDLDEYFKQNPGIFSKMKGKDDTSVNTTSSCIVPSIQPDSPQLEDTYDNFFFNNMVENPDFRYEATHIIDDNDSNQSGQSQTDNSKIGEEQKEISESSSIKDETKPQSENNDETTAKEKVRHLVFDKDSEKFLELKKQMVIVNDKNELESTIENINDEESNNTINKTESRAINRQSESKSSLSEKQSDDDMKIYVAESLPSSDDGNNNSPRPHEGATNHSDRSPCTAHDDANITNMPQTDQESVTNESDMPPSVDIEITTNEQKRSTSTENMYDAVKHHSRQKKSTHSTSQSLKSHINQQQNAQFPLMGNSLFPPSVQSKNNEIKAMQQNQQFKLEDVAMYMREPTKKLLLSLKLMSKKLTNNGTHDFSHFKSIRFTHIKILNDGQTKNTIGEFIPAFLSDQLLRCIRCISCNGCFSPYRFMKHICTVQWTRVSEKSFQNPLMPTEVHKGSAIGVWKLLFYVLDMEKHLSKNKNVQNIDELPLEITRGQIHTYPTQREAQPNNGQAAHTYPTQREAQPNNGQAAHTYPTQREAQPNNGQAVHTYPTQREAQPNNGQTAHTYTAQREAQVQREAQSNNGQTVHTYTGLQQISMDDRSCQQQYQSYQYPQINQSLACQTGSTVHHPPRTYQQVCSNQTSQPGSHVRYPPPYIQQSNINQGQSQHRRHDQPSQNVITNVGTSYQPTFQPTSQSSYASGANLGNTYQPIIQTNQPCHPFVNPQMNYRYQTHLMSKPQQNLSNNMTTYNVQQTSSVASSNFIGQIHQQMTNKNQSTYRPSTQNVLLMQMLMDDIKVPGIRSDNVHALPQRNQSTYVESISKEQGTRSDNVLVLPKENQSELQSTSSLTENENIHCNSRFNSNQNENISGTAQHGNKCALDTILPNENQKNDSSATSEENQCLKVTLCNNTNTQSDTGLTSSETNNNNNSTPVTSVTCQLSPMTTPELSCQPPAVQSISSKPGGSESRRRSFPSYQESNKQEMRQTPEKYQEILTDKENAVNHACTAGPDVPLTLDVNEVPSCSSSAANNVPKKNMSPHSNSAEKEVVPCLNSAGNETQNQTRPLHFQRPSDVIKAFKFAQDVQFQAISKLQDFILKDQEKQEKLQKDFEDEQERRIVAEKKLEDLEKKIGSMAELLQKKS